MAYAIAIRKAALLRFIMSLMVEIWGYCTKKGCSDAAFYESSASRWT